MVGVVFVFSHPASWQTKGSPSIIPPPSCAFLWDGCDVEILKCGVGHKQGVLRMTDDEIFSRVSELGSLDVKIETIDSLFSDQEITFLKADIEGFEFPMLLGAEQVIRNNRPKIALTVYHDGNDFTEMREFLRNIHQDYQFKTKGIAANGNPVLFLAF